MKAAIAFAIYLFAIMFFGLMPLAWMMIHWHGPNHSMEYPQPHTCGLGY